MKLWTISSYLLNILLIFNTSNMILFWTLMELNLAVFILMMNEKLKESSNLKEMGGSLYYFMIQSFSSFIFLTACTFSQEMPLFLTQMMMVMSLILKMSMFPFHKWNFNISKNMENVTLVILLTIQKIPILYFMTNMSFPMTMNLLMMNMTFGCLVMMKSKNLKNLFISSSIYSGLWTALMMLKSNMMFILSSTLYTSFLWFMMIKDKKNLKMIYLMFFTGLPPISMFYFKMNITHELTQNWSKEILILIWISTFLALTAYMKMLYSLNFLESKWEKSSEKKLKMKKWMILILGSWTMM